MKTNLTKIIEEKANIFHIDIRDDDNCEKLHEHKVHNRETATAIIEGVIAEVDERIVALNNVDKIIELGKLNDYLKKTLSEINA